MVAVTWWLAGRRVWVRGGALLTLDLTTGPWEPWLQRVAPRLAAAGLGWHWRVTHGERLTFLAPAGSRAAFRAWLEASAVRGD